MLLRGKPKPTVQALLLSAVAQWHDVPLLTKRRICFFLRAIQAHVHILRAHMCTFASRELLASLAVTLAWGNFYDFEYLVVSLCECCATGSSSQLDPTVSWDKQGKCRWRLSPVFAMTALRKLLLLAQDESPVVNISFSSGSGCRAVWQSLATSQGKLAGVGDGMPVECAHGADWLIAHCLQPLTRSSLAPNSIRSAESCW